MLPYIVYMDPMGVGILLECQNVVLDSCVVAALPRIPNTRSIKLSRKYGSFVFLLAFDSESGYSLTQCRSNNSASTFACQHTLRCYVEAGLIQADI